MKIVIDVDYESLGDTKEICGVDRYFCSLDARGHVCYGQEKHYHATYELRKVRSK
jgi:hypothetical protein